MFFYLIIINRLQFQIQIVNMNLTQIERRFQCLELHSSYINHKYGAAKGVKRIEQIKQNVHREALQEDEKLNKQVFGTEAFEKKMPRLAQSASVKDDVIQGSKRSLLRHSDSQKQGADTISQRSEYIDYEEMRKRGKDPNLQGIGRKDSDTPSEFEQAERRGHGQSHILKVPTIEIQEQGQKGLSASNKNLSGSGMLKLDNSQHTLMGQSRGQNKFMESESAEEFVTAKPLKTLKWKSKAIYSKHVLEQYRMPLKVIPETGRQNSAQQIIQGAVDFTAQKQWNARGNRKPFIDKNCSQHITAKRPYTSKKPEVTQSTSAAIMNQLYKIKIPDHIINVLNQYVVQQPRNDLNHVVYKEPQMVQVPTSPREEPIKLSENSQQDTISGNRLLRQKSVSSERPTKVHDYAKTNVDNGKGTKKMISGHPSTDCDVSQGKSFVDPVRKSDPQVVDIMQPTELCKTAQGGYRTRVDIEGDSPSARQLTAAYRQPGELDTKKHNIEDGTIGAKTPEIKDNMYHAEMMLGARNGNRRASISPTTTLVNVKHEEDSTLMSPNPNTKIEPKSTVPSSFEVHLKQKNAVLPTQATPKIGLNPLSAMDPITAMLSEQTTDLLFDLKLTDLSEPTNPFVVFRNHVVDAHGYLVFRDQQVLGRGGMVTLSTDQSQKFVTGGGSLLQQERIEDQAGNLLNPTSVFPWLAHTSELEKRTLKIEVTFRSEVILLRFIHLDRLYPVEYPKIALQIAHNMLQTALLVEEQEQYKQPQVSGSKIESSRKLLQSRNTNMAPKTQQIQTKESLTSTMPKGDSVISVVSSAAAHQRLKPITEKNQSTIFEEDPSISVRMQPALPRANRQSSEQRMTAYSRSQKTQVNTHVPTYTPGLNDYDKQTVNGMLRIHKNDSQQVWFSLRPQSNEIYTILHDLRSFKLHVTQVSDYLKQKRLISFPAAIPKNMPVLVEFADCILQAQDLLEYDVVADDNKDRKRQRQIIEQQQAAQLGFGNTLKVRPICREIVPDSHGIVHEPEVQAPVGRHITKKRAQTMMRINKSQAARYYILRSNVQKAAKMRAINQIKQAGDEYKPTIQSNGMTNQYCQSSQYSVGSSGFVTRPIHLTTIGSKVIGSTIVCQDQEVGNLIQTTDEQATPTAALHKPTSPVDFSNYGAIAQQQVMQNGGSNNNIKEYQFGSFISVSQASSSQNFNSVNYTLAGNQILQNLKESQGQQLVMGIAQVDDTRNITGGFCKPGVRASANETEGRKTPLTGNRVDESQNLDDSRRPEKSDASTAMMNQAIQTPESKKVTIQMDGSSQQPTIVM